MYITFKILLFNLTLIALSTSCNSFSPNENLKFAGQQLIKVAELVEDSTKFPRSSENGKEWRTVNSGNWVSGFYPGCLWYLYEHSGKDKYKKLAKKWTQPLQKEQFHTYDHDIGFIMFNSYGNGITWKKRGMIIPLL